MSFCQRFGLVTATQYIACPAQKVSAKEAGIHVEEEKQQPKHPKTWALSVCEDPKALKLSAAWGPRLRRQLEKSCEISVQNKRFFVLSEVRRTVDQIEGSWPVEG